MKKTMVALFVGIGIGILIAPDKGSTTLRKLRGRVDDLKDQAKDGIDDLADSATDVIKTAKSRAKRVLD